MSSADSMKLFVVGSVGIDTVETPKERREEMLGGSASFACVAASYFTGVGMVGVVGSDFPEEYTSLYKNHHVDLEGLQVVEGKTFRWSGVYENNMDNRRTLSTDLNVFEQFSPELPPSYFETPYVFLANIQPALQMHVLDQTRNPKFVLLDTMDLWIDIARDELVDAIGQVTMLTLNESEALKLTGKSSSLLAAAKDLLGMGPKYVIIKKGAHGSMLFSEAGIFILPAYPLERFDDPTGAGDTFAGAFMGALAESDDVSEAGMRRAMVYGSVVASFGVEDFSLDRLSSISRDDIEERTAALRQMMRPE